MQEVLIPCWTVDTDRGRLRVFILHDLAPLEYNLGITCKQQWVASYDGNDKYPS